MYKIKASDINSVFTPEMLEMLKKKGLIKYVERKIINEKEEKKIVQKKAKLSFIDEFFNFCEYLKTINKSGGLSESKISEVNIMTEIIKRKKINDIIINVDNCQRTCRIRATIIYLFEHVAKTIKNNNKAIFNKFIKNMLIIIYAMYDNKYSATSRKCKIINILIDRGFAIKKREIII